MDTFHFTLYRLAIFFSCILTLCHRDICMIHLSLPLNTTPSYIDNVADESIAQNE